MKFLIVSLTSLFLTLPNYADESEINVENRFILEVDRLNIFKSFKDFIFSRKDHDEDMIELEFSLIDDNNLRMNGVRITMEKQSGKLLAIDPIMLKRELDETTLITHWAFDQFHGANISFDALWEIVRAAMDDNVDDKEIFIMIFSGISTHEDTEFTILDGGPVARSLTTNGWNGFIEGNKIRIKDLAISLDLGHTK